MAVLADPSRGRDEAGTPRLNVCTAVRKRSPTASGFRRALLPLDVLRRAARRTLEDSPL
jgi:hypothetical protein